MAPRTSSRRWNGGWPIFSGLTILIVVALILGLLGTGRLRTQEEDGRLLVLVGENRRTIAAFAHRDSWLLLGLAVLLGWSAAAALDHSNLVAGSEQLIPATVISVVVGWGLAITGVRRLGFILLSLLTAVLLMLALAGPTWPGPFPGLDARAALDWLERVSLPQHTLLLAGLVALMALTGSWTDWWMFRRGNGLVALLPTGATIAVEALNDLSPAITALTILWLVVSAVILLRMNFVSLKQRWRQRRVPRAADTAWDFGESGAAAILLIVLLAFLVLPPLTSQDVSSYFVPGTSSSFQFHPFGIGAGGSGPGGSAEQVGYSETIAPGASLTARPVTVMFVSGETSDLYPYWKGISEGGWDGKQWYPLPGDSVDPNILPVGQTTIAAGQPIQWDGLPDSPKLQPIITTFEYFVPPGALDHTVFMVGEPLAVDGHPTLVRGLQSDTAIFDTVDHVQVRDTPRVPFQVTVHEVVVKADVQSLQKASTDYPSWVEPYRDLYFNGRTASGLSIAADGRIADLARSLTTGATNPYDAAKAIETWFLAKGRFHYTLQPPKATRGTRQLDYFLFTSRRGYCQDFATAMAVMLRTLGIPARLASGFGLGNYDDRAHRFQVATTDAHVWVEAYFPGYGWIPFEPTPDGNNFPVSRPLTPAAFAAGGTSSAIGIPNLATRPRGLLGRANENVPIAGGNNSLTAFWNRLAIGGGILVVLLLLAGLVLARWLLYPRDLPRVWRRLLILGDRLRVPRYPGDTPREYAVRLGRAAPEVEPEVGALAGLYTRQRFRRGGLSRKEAQDARQTWLKVRRRYPGLLVRSFRRAPDDAFSPVGGGRSGSPLPGSRRQRPGPGRGG